MLRQNEHGSDVHSGDSTVSRDVWSSGAGGGNSEGFCWAGLWDGAGLVQGR